MPRAKATTMYRANTSGACEVGGTEYQFRSGELFAPDHPLIKACPDYFEPAEDAVRPASEAATAGPGEVRGEE